LLEFQNESWKLKKINIKELIVFYLGNDRSTQGYLEKLDFLFNIEEQTKK